MSQLHTVVIGGYGPVKIRGLSAGEVREIAAACPVDHLARVAEAVRRGCCDLAAMDDDAFFAEFTDRPEAVALIGQAIIDRSPWGAL